MIAIANFRAESDAGKFGTHLNDRARHGDVLPWADPYIAQLIDDHGAELAREEQDLRLVGWRALPRPSPRAMAVAS
jgi:hypothetical protein